MLYEHPKYNWSANGWDGTFRVTEKGTHNVIGSFTYKELCEFFGVKTLYPRDTIISVIDNINYNSLSEEITSALVNLGFNRECFAVSKTAKRGSKILNLTILGKCNKLPSDIETKKHRFYISPKYMIDGVTPINGWYVISSSKK